MQNFLRKKAINTSRSISHSRHGNRSLKPTKMRREAAQVSPETREFSPYTYRSGLDLQQAVVRLRTIVRTSLHFRQSGKPTLFLYLLKLAFASTMQSPLPQEKFESVESRLAKIADRRMTAFFRTFDQIENLRY